MEYLGVGTVKNHSSVEFDSSGVLILYALSFRLLVGMPLHVHVSSSLRSPPLRGGVES